MVTKEKSNYRITCSIPTQEELEAIADAHWLKYLRSTGKKPIFLV